ncbi:hypothetical protein BZB76_5564 [Actinomadura pelletieri DSM 43383]|uniref:Uncharacterized protein n=1 Tax=Actinomadura pelletieri DSM 43383 TaxID=1120940 RepID=A0A495QGW0_9ACTN|nr:hypothetical protein [Actinomadura pelletieri]RKS71078.1 hypothetical protein BZB76_5564 [Actinomadura pelletieri DSM 43383]
MRQGTFHYALIQRKSLGGILTVTREQPCLVVSNDRYNGLPNTKHVWVLRTRGDGQALSFAALDHVPQADLDPEELDSASKEYVSDALDWVRWGISGDQPWRNTPMELQEAHREALRVGDHLRQGDIVTDGHGTAVVISGPALNSIPGGDVVWALGVVSKEEISLGKVINLPTSGLTKIDAMREETRAGLLAAVLDIL